MSFEFLGLSPDVLKAVEEAGYTEPTPIQRQAIPTVLMGRDILGIAQTGTGKTASFVLPMLDILAQGRARARMPRSLIIEPTRELAAQVADSFETYGKHSGLRMALLIGGVSFGDQEKKLDRGVDVLVATPGRLLDHFGRGKLMLTGVEILVIDEADRMLDMGFIPDVERIRSLIPAKPQILFFSATMPKEIKRLTDNFLSDPKEIAVAPPATTLENVTQHLIVVGRRDKERTLKALIAAEDIVNGIIFCNRKKDVDALYKSLSRLPLSVAALHGDMDQYRRTAVLDSFRAGEITLLVASDVAARGLDIPAVSHIFNYDVPYQPDDYVHRIGRTGRAGRPGKALMLAAPDDGKAVDAIIRLIGRDIPVLEVEAIRQSKFEEPERPRGGARGRGRRPARGQVREKARPGTKARPAQAADKPERADATPSPAANKPKRADAAPAAAANRPKRADAAPGHRRPPPVPKGESGRGSDLPAFIRKTVERSDKTQETTPKSKK